MARITAIVVKLDNGMYRRLDLSKIKALYTDEQSMCAGTIQPGEGGMAGPETREPDFSEDPIPATASPPPTTRSNGNGPNCYVVNGTIVCD